MKNLFTVFAFTLVSFFLQAQAPTDTYMGFAAPKQELVLFAPNLISSPYYERDIAISPDQKEIYFTIASFGHLTQTLVRIRKEKNNWSEPEILPFSGTYRDLEPAFSPDGKRLYFCSNRPLDSQDKSQDFNIWYAERQGRGWSEPISVGESINTEADEFYPSVASNGSLYFTAAYKNAKGKEDIYCARWTNNAYQKPELLSDSINQAGFEFNAFIAPDESYLLFTAYGRTDDKGGGDLYMAVKNTEGIWMKSKNLGPKINSNKIDYCPYVSADGKYLFFTSERHRADFTQPQKSYKNWLQNIQSPQNGLGDIYWIEAPWLVKGAK